MLDYHAESMGYHAVCDSEGCPRTLDTECRYLDHALDALRADGWSLGWKEGGIKAHTTCPDHPEGGGPAHG